MTRLRTTASTLALLALCGCSEVKPTSVPKTDNPDAAVERLFTVDGCTVYRFWDVGDRRYFASCQGSVSWQERQGKVTKDLDVPTGEHLQ